MALAITHSRASIGIQAPIVTVETHISNGLPSLNIVGLPETVVKESKDRVRSAILNSHFEFPTRRITVNLAPADLPKLGGRYDLPIALGILAASKQIPSEALSEYEFAGELALSGELRPITGILPLALGTKKAGKSLILPYQNAVEAEIITEIKLLPARHLLEVCAHFLNKVTLQPLETKKMTRTSHISQDLKEVRGQHHAKRALEISAAGQHSLLFVGPPGVGKTMLSNCLPDILPALNEQEAIELAAIQSIAGTHLDMESWAKRPFRSPHHSASSFALIGGGNPPKPGEISLAHHGILFLDELPEFKRSALEALREPLETGVISISRANFQVQYPAKFQLIAAMNPCPCGQFGNLEGECICHGDQIRKYQSRLSGPLLDRIDLQAELQSLPPNLLIKKEDDMEGSAEVLQRVEAARNSQLLRAGKLNYSLGAEEITQYCCLTSKDKAFIEQFMHQKKISARSYHKILKVARTIADLAQVPDITIEHIKESLSYRFLENSKKI